MSGGRLGANIIGRVGEDPDLLAPRERARIRSRDRKVRGPRMVVDNPGLKKLLVDLAEKRRRARRRRRPS